MATHGRGQAARQRLVALDPWLAAFPASTAAEALETEPPPLVWLGCFHRLAGLDGPATLQRKVISGWFQQKVTGRLLQLAVKAAASSAWQGG